MKNIVLDGKNMETRDDFHDIVTKNFDLPSYYARNLDSLWELLLEFDELSILIMNAEMIEKNLGKFGKSVLRLFDNLNKKENYKVDYIFAGCYMCDINFDKSDEAIYNEIENFTNKENKPKDKNDLIDKTNNVYTVKEISGKYPNIDETTYIAEGARIIGDVTLAENSSIWYNAVLRADYNSIKIGKNSNIQDNSVIHNTEDAGVVIGDNVTVGHSAIIHSANISDNVLIGMGSIILSKASIGKNTIIGAGSLVTEGTNIPEESLVLGSPAKVVRKLSIEEIDSIVKNAEDYVLNVKKHI